MLDPIAQLAEHVIGDVGGGLGHEVDADPLGANQAHRLLEALKQCLGSGIEQQVGLVEEEHQHRAVGIAAFGEGAKERRQEPQQEGGIEAWALHQLTPIEQIDEAACLLSLARGCQHVIDVERRFGEEALAALGGQHMHPAQHGTEALGADTAIALLEVFALTLDMLQQADQVLEVDQLQPFTLGMIEGQVHQATLGVVQFQQGRHQLRPHGSHAGTHRMPTLAEQIPQPDGSGLRLPVIDAEAGEAFIDARMRVTRRGDAGEVTLDVGGEHRHSHARKLFCQHL